MALICIPLEKNNNLPDGVPKHTLKSIKSLNSVKS